jgi:hypothetical protein
VGDRPPAPLEQLFQQPEIVIRSDPDKVLQEIRTWNRKKTKKRNYPVTFETADQAVDLFIGLLDRKYGVFKTYTEAPVVEHGTRKPRTWHWDLDTYENGQLVGHSQYGPHGFDPHMQVDTDHHGTVRIYWERDRFALLDPDAEQLAQPPVTLARAQGATILASPGTPDPELQVQRPGDAADLAAQELIRALSKDQEVQPRQAVGRPDHAAGGRCVAGERAPARGDLHAGGHETRRLAPEATAPPTGPVTAFETTVHTPCARPCGHWSRPRAPRSRPSPWPGPRSPRGSPGRC